MTTATPPAPHPAPDAATSASAQLTAGLHFAGLTGAGDDGLWQTYDGQAMVMDLFGTGPVLALVDLETLSWPDRVPALDEHETDQPVGWWSATRPTQVGAGLVLTQRLTLLRPPAESAEAPIEWTDHHYRAAGIRGLLRAGMPLQASIRVEPDPNRAGIWESVTTATPINGRLVDPAAHQLPMVVLRRGWLRETSLVTLGQSLATGQLAARLAAAAPAPPPTEPPPPSAAQPPETITMDLKERMAALLEQHGETYKPLILEQLVEGASDEDITTLVTETIEAEKNQELADATAALAEKEELVASLQASLAEKDQALAKAQSDLAAATARRTPPAAQGVAHASAAASLRRSAMSKSERLAYAAAHGADALAALPY